MILPGAPMEEIETLQQMKEYIFNRSQIQYVAFQNIDCTGLTQEIMAIKFENCVFLGCKFDDNVTIKLLDEKNLIFPELQVPFNPYRASLYTAEELYDKFDAKDPDSYDNTTDGKIYRHYLKTGKFKPYSIYETLARRMHDHSITDALMEVIDHVHPKKIIAFMGGHRLSRETEDYKSALLLSKHLTEHHYVMLSGGGPGAMEATHLGAWLAGYSDDVVGDVLSILAKTPKYMDAGWLNTAFEVMEKFPCKVENRRDIAVPTWLHGDEPSTPFAAKIAKYFANSVREEGLLALALGGVVYFRGSAGTIREVFQDTEQNHYNSYGMASPMIFFNKEYWEKTKPIYPLLKKISKKHEYHQLLHISNDIAEVEGWIEDFTKRP